MNIKSFLIASALMSLGGATGQAMAGDEGYGGNRFDSIPCYAPVAEPGGPPASFGALRLNVKYHGPLVGSQERRAGFPDQSSFDIAGKAVALTPFPIQGAPLGAMAPVTGTGISGKGKGTEWFLQIFPNESLLCLSEEDTAVPNEFSCLAAGQAGATKFQKIDPLTDPQCSTFLTISPPDTP